MPSTDRIDFGLVVANQLDGGPDPLDVIRRAEQAGFALAATHPDHPTAVGQFAGGRSLETWTLLSWAAAHTSTIRLAPCVLSLPYRHPGVVAKMAESLDRLSGGRLVLALGAGGDDDAFASFGLTERDPAGKIAALDEAVGVIRQLWDGRAVTHHGQHYTIEGGRIQPAAQRDIPLWLGVFGDRMLELVARQADGWLPSLFMVPRPAIYDKLDRLRDAVRAAGRDPDELTYACNVAVRVDADAGANPRLVAGSTDDVTGQLTEMVDHGFDLLNLWPQGEVTDQIGRLAEQILPAVRARAA